MAGSRWRVVTSWLGRRPAALPLLVLGAASVAVAAGPSPAAGAWVGMPDGELIRSALAIVMLLGAAVGLAILVLARGETVAREQPVKRSWWSALAVVAVILLLSLLSFDTELTEVDEAERPPEPAADVTAPAVAPGEGFETSDGLALMVVVVAALGLLWWARRGLVESAEPDEPDRGDHALAAAVARAHHHLVDGDDPRAAVLLAYHDLEMTLAALDLDRQPSETPTEHLARALPAAGLTDAGPARPLLDLGGLYARARFSDHPITEADRRRAAEALGRARRRLAVP